MFGAFSRSALRRTALAAVPCTFGAVVGSDTRCSAARCDAPTPSSAAASRLLRKRNTLQEATTPGLRKFSTKQELSKIRANEKQMLERWEKDEDGWRELPARAWPAYQPNPDQLKDIQATMQSMNCSIDSVTQASSTSSSTRWWRLGSKSNNSSANSTCQELIVQQATALVFYNIDAQAGLEQFEALAKQGHVDAMVACGVVLVEGLGVAPREEEAIAWLRKAVASGSAQACYELATVLYTGVDGFLDEDPEAAFQLFQRAAAQDHTGALYMMADCLVEGEGTEQDIGKAVPLFYRAAERGHRFSRQRIRELLAQQEYR